jgi:hypothetical protein
VILVGIDVVAVLTASIAERFVGWDVATDIAAVERDLQRRLQEFDADARPLCARLRRG